MEMTVQFDATAKILTFSRLFEPISIISESQGMHPQKTARYMGFFKDRTRLIFSCWNIEEIKTSRQLDDL